jgi:hypothetical protein
MKLDDYNVFKNNKKTLQHTSRDTSKTPVQFMTLDTRKVVDFDCVKTDIFSNDFGEKDSIARSADALFSTEQGIYIVEFKNGSFTNLEISEKANNSIMLFNYVTSKQIDYTRKNISFVLVYNKDVKTLSWEDSIALHRAVCAKTGFKGFGTDKLKGFSYKDVYMIEKKDIDSFLRTI